MLKKDRPIKVVIRGLPSNTEPEDIKTEIEAEGFKVAKNSQMKNYRSKAPMPLFYPCLFSTFRSKTVQKSLRSMTSPNYSVPELR
ncbi:zinc finger protein [Trichonephila clavipes]|nr:zinc finger protein [Trichonephila clavipes]